MRSLYKSTRYSNLFEITAGIAQGSPSENPTTHLMDTAIFFPIFFINLLIWIEGFDSLLIAKRNRGTILLCGKN